MQFHAVGNNLYTTLAGNVAAIDTSIDVAASGLDDLPVPFLADLGGEIVEVTEVTEDTPAPGTTRWTVTRAYYGAAGVYSAGIPVAQRNYAEQYTELQTAASKLWYGQLFTLGGDNGCIANADDDFLRVTPGTGLEVDVSLGFCVVDGEPVLCAGGSVTVPAPVSGTTNYQILVDGAGALSANEDTALQDPPEGYILLADVEVESTDTEIVEGDINDRRTVI